MALAAWDRVYILLMQHFASCLSIKQVFCVSQVGMCFGQISVVLLRWCYVTSVLVCLDVLTSMLIC